MRAELDDRGIEIVTICADTPAQIERGRRRHGLRAVMLSDADLRVTDLYNLRHRRGLAAKRKLITSLPIPTAILVDADGVVRWIDQAADYQVRTHPDRVLAEIERNLPRRSGAAPPTRDASGSC